MVKNKIILLGIFLSFVGVYAQKKPNVVFIISDQHKLEATGAYGSKLAITPHIDNLAKTGVIFNNCYTSAPVCAPARASLITGMYPYANGAIYHKVPVTMPNGKIKNMGSGYLRETGYHENIKTLPEVFREQNYVTAAPGKMHVHGELQKNIDEDFKTVLKNIGIKKILHNTNDKLNVRKHKPFHEYYQDDETLKKVNSLMDEDFKHLEYERIEDITLFKNKFNSN